ncbi:hypothetical protein Chor_008788, partial [Crotalus horridus]
DPMITGQVSKLLLSVQSEMNAELRGEDKAAASEDELDKSLLVAVESNDNEDTPSKLFEEERKQIKLSYLEEPTSGERRVGTSFLCPA